MKESTRERHTVRRILSMLLVVVMLAALLAVPAMAANRISRSGQYTNFTVTTGSGFTYWLGWSKTRVTVTNTGSRPLTVYAPGLRGYVSVPGRTSRSFEAKGSGKRYKYTVQGDYGRKVSYQVYVSAGSIR